MNFHKVFRLSAIKEVQNIFSVGVKSQEIKSAEKKNLVSGVMWGRQEIEGR